MGFGSGCGFGFMGGGGSGGGGGSVTLPAPLRYTSPADNTATYTNASLIGLTTDQFMVWREGFLENLTSQYTFVPGTGTVTFLPDLGAGENVQILILKS